MNVLVTGGAGFIGTALSKELKNRGHNITIIDLESKLSDFHLREFDCYGIDIREYKNLQVIKHRKLDVVYHLAAQTSGAISQEEPEMDVDTNVKGTLNICNFARENKINKIIFTSSMAVYGNKTEQISETSLVNPISNYGVSKVSGEFYIKLFEQYGIKHTIFRLFNVYGPGQDMTNLKQGMASIFLAQSITQNEIHITGSLKRYRDFVYIDDVVSALCMALNGQDGEVFNVGTGKKTTVEELIDIIFKINSKPYHLFSIKNIGGHDGDQYGTISNSNKLMALGWIPSVNLHEGIQKMYEYAMEVMR